MRNLGKFLVIGLLGAGLWGCRDSVPPVARAIPPEIGQDTYRREADYPKPLPNGPQTVVPVSPGLAQGVGQPLPPPLPEPGAAAESGSAPVADAPTFMDMYNRVNHPRIIVYVNRGLDGQLLPAHDPRSGQAAAPADNVAKPGDVDDAGLDYGMVESLLADWLSCDGKVTVIPPATVRSQLSDEQIKTLQAGKEDALAALGGTLQGHVLIQVQLRGVKKTDAGLETKMFAEAMNVRGGDLLARASVDVQPPLNEAQWKSRTQALAADLMAGMRQTWSQPAPAPAKDSAAPANGKTAPVGLAAGKSMIPVTETAKGLGAGNLPAPLPPPPVDK